MNKMKPYSESCIQNQQHILKVLQPLLSTKKHVLEIGSGTGQHAVYFAKHMPHLIWQTSDQIEYLEGIQLWLDEAGLNNTPPPIPLNVSSNLWPTIEVDTIFSANAVHIMSWQNVIDFFTNAATVLKPEGLFILYGPFNYFGQYTSESNARFDQWLKQSDPNSGIRDFDALNELALKAGMIIAGDMEMPANNRILYWAKN